MVFLTNAQVHLTLHENFEEKLLLFFPHYFTVLLLCSIVGKFSKYDRIPGSKMTFYESYFSFEKAQVKNLTWLESWRYSPCSNSWMRLKNRLNILLHAVWACYTHFSDDYLLISSIYSFRCLYNILHHLKEHSTPLANFSSIVYAPSSDWRPSQTSIYKSIAVLLKLKTSNEKNNWVAGDFPKLL